MRLMNLICMLLCTLLIAPAVFAQAPATGFPPYGSFQHGNFDAVNVQDLNFNFSIPIVSTSSRGMNFASPLVYNSLSWYRAPSNYWFPVSNTGTGDSTLGWQTPSPIGQILYGYLYQTSWCDFEQTKYLNHEVWNSYQYVDMTGTVHNFTGVYHVRDYDECTNTTTESGVPGGFADDGSGYLIDITTVYDPVVQSSSGTGIKIGSATDTNGNVISSTPVGTETDWKDSSGRTSLRTIPVGSTVEYHFTDASGLDQKYILKYRNYGIMTKFACPGTIDYNLSGTRPQVSLPYELELPNHKTYQFAYEPTPGYATAEPPGFTTGRIIQVTLPTGGSVQYSFGGPNDGINCADGSLLNLTRTISGGTAPATWQYVRTQSGSNWTTTVTAPAMPYDATSNQTVYTFDANAHETTQQIYQGTAGGTPLRTITTSWTTPPQFTPITPASRVTTLEDGTTQSKTETSYDPNSGNLLSVKEYDWGLTALRTTIFEYNTDVNYTSRNILNRLSKKTILDGGGTVQYRQDIKYDETALSPCPTGIAQHDDTNYPCTFRYRGNPTSVITYKTPGTPANPVTKTTTYDVFGNVITASVNCCQQKTFNYSATTNYSFPDSELRGTTPTLTTSATYNPWTGQVMTATDENNEQTTYAYNDSMKRLTSVTRPDNAQITYAYDDTALTVTTNSPLQGTSTVTQTVTYNGLGQPILTAVSGGSKVQTIYDPIGRVYQTSNPFTGASTSYVATNKLDALGRPTAIVLPDSSQTSYSYSKNTLTVTDPASKQRRNYSDALGRLTQVDEPAGGSSATSGTGTVTMSPSGSERFAASPGSQGPNNCGTGSGVNRGGTQAWTWPQDIAISGSYPAFILLPHPGDSDYLVATNFGFSVPSNATIKGISASFSRYADNPNVILDLFIQLTKNGTSPIGTDHSSGTAWPTTAAVASYGGSTDLWGTTWTPAEISASTFGLMIAIKSIDTLYNEGAYVPAFVTITVNYTIPSGTPDTGTVSVTVNAGSGFTATATYGQNSTPSTIAADLNAALNNPSFPVTATLSGNTISLTSKATELASNYPLTCISATNSAYFTGTSFPISCSGLSGGKDATGPSLSTPNSTVYAYNVFDKVIGVTQGAQTRTYGYDNLGRLKNVKTPETNQLATTYDYNDFDLPITRTDPHGVITSYGYDGLNRLYTVSYNVGTTGVPATPTVTFTYGTDPAQNNNGRIFTMTDGVGSESYKYDILGQVKQVDKVISGLTYTTLYDYNLAGEITKTTYPSGRAVTPGYDTLGRLSTLSDTFNSASTTYASGFTYNDAQQVKSFNYGNSVSATFTYSPDRLQLGGISYAKGAQTLFGLNYWYRQDTSNCPGGATGNNGQIQCITDGVDTGRTVAYTYDELSRLKTAQTNGSVPYPKWGLTWNYDRYSNRLAQIVTAGSGYNGSVSIDPTTNHIIDTPYAYDPNGNMTNDGANGLVYDGENRVVSAASANYTYDGNGLRVKKAIGASSTVYVFSGSKVIAEYDNGVVPTSPSREYIYAGSQLLATITGSATKYDHPDHLSVRLTTDTVGNLSGQQAHYPFGDSWYVQSTTSKWQFTSYERDPESGNDYAMARYYVNRLGGFNSPDPAGLDAVDPTTPQSWNRYAYVMNNPMNSVDPQGLSDCPDLKIGCMPSNECLSGAWCGGFSVDILGGRNFWNGTPYVGIGGGNFGRSLVMLSVFQSYSVETDVTTTETNIDASLGYDFLTYFLALPTVFGGGGGGSSGGKIVTGDGRTCTPSVFDPSCKPPSCPAVFAETALHDLIGPYELLFHAAAEPSVKAATQAAVTKHIVERGLSTPLRSSIVRRYLLFGELASDVLIAGAVIKSEIVGLNAEKNAWRSGACTTIWSK